MTIRYTIDDIELLELAKTSNQQKQAVLDIRNERAIRDNMYTNHVISKDEHARWIKRITGSENDIFWAVIVDGNVVGGASINKLDKANRKADWAFYLSEHTHGMGLGFLLEIRVLDYAFETLKLSKLNCEVLDFNEAVVRFHKKFGFVQEGVRRRHLLRDEKWHDTILLGITDDEWHDRRADMIAKTIARH